MDTHQPTDSEAEAEFRAAVQEALASADAGNLIPFSEVKTWLESWGTENELPPPITRQK